MQLLQELQPNFRLNVNQIDPFFLRNNRDPIFKSLLEACLYEQMSMHLCNPLSPNPLWQFTHDMTHLKLSEQV